MRFVFVHLTHTYTMHLLEFWLVLGRLLMSSIKLQQSKNSRWAPNPKKHLENKSWRTLYTPVISGKNVFRHDVDFLKWSVKLFPTTISSVTLLILCVLIKHSSTFSLSLVWSDVLMSTVIHHPYVSPEHLSELKMIL